MINYDLQKIKAVVFDVDGVLSASTIQMDGKGEPVRTINIKDGYAIQLAVKHGIRLAIMTGGHNENIRFRYEYLGVKDVYINCSMKIRTWEELLSKYDLHEEEIIYVGDDIPDYEVMKRAGCPCCPKDACMEIKEISTYVSDYEGGHGVARDILEQVLKAQGKWVLNEKAFGW
ncbi:KdsC family phosphatase [Prevotella denticola]|uniref:KdsC family phosphatase n=1 Tax=Prevotella denticola TaxID=28129 RepID=UPI00020133D4|nr:HAD-IIIA family hydrolase [Prevotella denticola]AEA21692.1 3-deoxy-D-manno-octulosonate 8-phosphate phosphatase, YrbI family [Prevotella denticola F0289]MBF1387445.1 HAD-IIIA family hydrolase [Prevotella denticola]QUB89121.1 HAD-IIIA family hydrolase [Prevotella denticola]